MLSKGWDVNIYFGGDWFPAKVQKERFLFFFTRLRYFQLKQRAYRGAKVSRLTRWPLAIRPRCRGAVDVLAGAGRSEIAPRDTE